MTEDFAGHRVLVLTAGHWEATAPRVLGRQPPSRSG